MTLWDKPNHLRAPHNSVSQRGLNFLWNIMEFEAFNRRWNAATLDKRLHSSAGSALCDSCTSSPPHYILHHNHRNNINTCAHSARPSQIMEESTLVWMKITWLSETHLFKKFVCAKLSCATKTGWFCCCCFLMDETNIWKK